MDTNNKGNFGEVYYDCGDNEYLFFDVSNGQPRKLCRVFREKEDSGDLYYRMEKFVADNVVEMGFGNWDGCIRILMRHSKNTIYCFTLKKNGFRVDILTFTDKILQQVKFASLSTGL